MCTVKPSSDYRYCDTHNASGHTEYAEIDLNSLKTKDDDDSDDATNNESAVNKRDKPRSNSNTELKRRSLPTVLPDSEAAAERDNDNTLNYLELNFPGADRPRNQSDGSRSPRVPPRSSKPQSRPGAYIELEFNGKEKNQDPTSDRERSSSGSGDGKSSSLPRH